MLRKSSSLVKFLVFTTIVIVPFLTFVGVLVAYFAGMPVADGIKNTFIMAVYMIGAAIFTFMFTPPCIGAFLVLFAIGDVLCFLGRAVPFLWEKLFR